MGLSGDRRAATLRGSFFRFVAVRSQVVIAVVSDFSANGRLAIRLLTSAATLFTFASHARPAAQTNAPATRITNVIARPLSPAVRSFLGSLTIKTGFRVDVMASEPLVSSPVAMTFDESGRLLVCENPGYLSRAPAPAPGRIRILEDTNGEGVFNASAIFADGLPSPSALICYNHGVFVATAENLLYLRSDGTRDVIYSGLSSATNLSVPPLLVNNFNWGPDGRIHCSGGAVASRMPTATGRAGEPEPLGANDFSIDPRSFAVLPESGPSESGVAFDNHGNRIVCDYTRPARLIMYEPQAYRRNPFFSAPDPLLDLIPPASDFLRYNAPDHSRSAAARGGAPVTNVLRPMPSGSTRGLAVYRGSSFPTNYLDHLFIPDTDGHLIHHAVLKRSGVAYIAQKPADEMNTEFLVSHSSAFNPVQVVNGPDGCLYVADFGGGTNGGHILRIAPSGARFGRSKVNLAKATTYELAAALSSPNGWHRDTASRLLGERTDARTAPLLTNVVQNSQNPLARLHALRLLSAMGFLNEHLALRGLIDPDENIRIAALQESERLMGGGMVSDTLWNQLHIMAGDASPAVRYQLALSLGQVGRPERVDLLAGMLNNDPENPWLRFAVLSSLGDSGARLLADLASDANWRNNPSQRRFIIELAGMIGVQGYLDDIGAAIDFVENGRLPALAWFDVLYGLGEGLRRTGSSLQLVDRQNRLHIFYDSATTAMFNGDWSVADRVAAIRFRSVTPIVSGTTDDMLQLLFGTRQPEGVEQAIASTSGRYDNPQLFDSLINSWQSLSAASRSEALASMLTRGFRLHQVVAGLQGGMVRPNEFTSVQLNFLRTYHDPSVSGAALKILGPIRTERPDVLKDFGPAAAMGGNAASGRGIFAARCASCHTPGPAASVCGPDLRTLRPFGKAVLLNAIIQPSARIRRGFSTYVLDTKESDIYYGIVRDENLLTVSIRQSNGETAVIPRNNIDVLQQQPWSLMPDGLEQGLSVQSMADLLEYLSGPTNP